MDTLDLTKKYKNYYSAKTKPELVSIETAKFLSITGKGDPAEKNYSDKIQALYSTAYAINFIFKQKGKEFTVANLECLWWFDEKRFIVHSLEDAPKKVPRKDWEYRLLIRIPDFVTTEEVQQGIQATISTTQVQLANEIELYEMTEGKSVQMLHVGPFEQEPETLSQMNKFMQANGLHKNGLHHEIYLSDYTKVSPEKFKTILREPVK
jgi:hypothetical protein